jgi:transglutaminase-like putative cysteine protease
LHGRHSFFRCVRVRKQILGFILALVPSVALAQFKDVEPSNGPRPDRESTTRIRIGVIVKNSGGPLYNAVATAPVPAEWPEQQVEIVSEDNTSHVRKLSYRSVAPGLRQMVVEIPVVLPGHEAKSLVTFEVTRRTLLAPKDTRDLKIPKKLDRQLSLCAGSSPYIESRHPKIVAASKEAVGEVESDWNKVEAIYDWTRDHVAYKKGDLKGAARALFDKEGDTDELTSVFIALCRAQKIPARTVFVLEHCYAEFYLEDDEGKGYWFPCQPAGQRLFGGIDELRPILQKGDNYKNPDNSKERLRYVSEHFTAASRNAKPSVEFVCELVNE